MLRILYISFSLAFSATLGACASVTQKASIIEVVEHKWRVKSVRLEKPSEKWVIVGELSSFNRNGLPNGYVDVTFLDENHQPLLKHVVNYRLVVGTGRRNHFGLAVLFKEIPPPPEFAYLVASLTIIDD